MSVFREHRTIADRSAGDRKRHREKIEKAIKEGIHHIVADESIIGKDETKRFKIPVKGIKEYKFIYGDGENNKSVGSAPGIDKKRGQILKDQSNDQSGQSNKAGNESGEEMYEVEITLDELGSYLFDNLSLPDLEKKKLRSILSSKNKRKGHRNKGIRPRLDKKETLKNRIKRRIIAERTGVREPESDEPFSFNERDLRYRHVSKKPKENTNAVVFFMMDVSGSMSKDKKYLARSFYFLLYQFLRYKYEKVDVVFISHTTEAQEVDEEKFFTRQESGGTQISSALQKTLDIIEDRYHPNAWNIYSFHCSDGDNWPDDVDKSINLSMSLRDVCQMYAYCEIEPEGERPAWNKDDSTMMGNYMPLMDSKFRVVKIVQKEDIWPVFTGLFGST